MNRTELLIKQWSEKFHGKDQLEEHGIDGRIILQ